MALSQITTECRRYGCMKNLLACFANCRYNTRCQELRNELEDKTEQAASDINRYLAEKSVPPIRIQLLTKGLKFIPLSKLEKPKREPKSKSLSSEKPRAEKNKVTRSKIVTSQSEKEQKNKSEPPISKKSQSVQSQPAKKKVSRKRKPMSRKANSVQTQSVDTPVTQTQEPKESRPKSVRSSRSTSRLNASPPLRKTKKSGSKKLYIIIENEAATVVDEQGLIRRMLAGPSAKARFFEAKEVEAQLQIVYKR
jgi:hypothetical protein